VRSPVDIVVGVEADGDLPHQIDGRRRDDQGRDGGAEHRGDG
jgi:hypothetical protein